MGDRGVGSELALRSGRIARCLVLALPLTAAIALALPARWESKVVLLPPEREAGNFRYGERGDGVEGLLSNLSVSAAMDPLDTWSAILASPETALRLVRRFDLAEEWGGGSEAEAAWLLLDRITFVEVPWGPVEVHVETTDRVLSADLANAAVEVLRERITELYREDAEWERGFLADASRGAIAAATGAEAALAAARMRAGVANDSLQARAASAAARDLALALARARSERARAAVLFGPEAPETRDAERRVRELARRAAPATPVLPAGFRAEEGEAGRAGRSADRLTRLWLATFEDQAGHEFELRVLDPAVPADRPARPVAGPVALALLLVPGAFAGAKLLGRELGVLPSLRDRGERAGRWLRDTPGGTIVAAVTVAAVAVTLGRDPLALAVVAGAVFLAVLAVDLHAAWLLLFIALPWAWDFTHSRAEVGVQIPTEPGIIALVGAWAYARALRPRPVPWSPILVGMLLVVAWTAVSSVTSLNPRNSVFQIVAITGFVLGGGVFPLVEIRTVERIELVIRILFFSAAAASVIGIVQVVTSPLPFGRAAFFIGEGFLYNHGPYAAFLGFAMGPAFVHLLSEQWSRRTLPVLTVALLVTVATVVSLARAGWLSMLVLLAALAIARGRQFVRKLAVPIALIAAVLVVGFLRSPFAAQAFAGYVERSTDQDYGSNVDRIQRYVAALRMFQDRPLTGVGPSAYERAYDDYRSVEFDAGIRGAHSELLRVAAEQGLPGLLILGFLVVAFYRTGLRLMRSAPDPRVRRIAGGLCAGMLTYSVHGLVNEYWRDAKIALLMWIFAGMLAALDRISRETQART